jgi:GTPase SAR1 family protein
MCNMDLMYEVSNRESFEALSRWLEELENYVPPEVVKIVVGNKLDEVKSSPLMIIILRRPLTHDTHARTYPTPHLGILSTSAHIRRRNVRSADGMSIHRGIR